MLTCPAPPPRPAEEEEEEEEEEEGGRRAIAASRARSVMEEEPVDLRSSEQTELLSLIISGEEEATHEGGDMGVANKVDSSSGSEGEPLANGHAGDESETQMVVAPVRSAATSYWSITEGPDQPLLLSPAPGPSGRKPRVQRASRSGLSRIPGRDHRRYYHEYWRSEYLMDFDPQRHGMICMVCGSSLATLKLSTIKRHIRQKHPDSLLWSAADKEVIRSGWESHLSLGGGQRSGSGPPVQEDDASMHFGSHMEESPDLVPPQQDPPPTHALSPRPVKEESLRAPEEEPEPAGPSARTLERYLNDSLHAWFRQEFLMEYEAEAGRLLCMVCGAELPSLHLDHIKGHVLRSHPTSLVLSSEQKHCILQAWAQSHGESDSVTSEPDAKGKGAELLPGDLKAGRSGDGSPEGHGTLTQDLRLIGEDGGVGAPRPAARQPRRRRLPGGDPWRLRLDYLVAYGPQDQGLFCMVCSQVLTESKVSSFRRHIQECHPETTALSRQEREAMAAAWTKDSSADGLQAPGELNSSEVVVFSATKGGKEDAACDVRAPLDTLQDDDSGGMTSGVAAAPRHGHYPGKDQRRNYQARWRMEYLMDYDCRRHGLICMVCGAALATLKVSTIKRHIQQVHPHTLLYGAAEKERAARSYAQSDCQGAPSSPALFASSKPPAPVESPLVSAQEAGLEMFPP